MFKLMKFCFRFTLFQALLICVNHVFEDINQSGQIINQSEQSINSKCFGVWCLGIVTIYFAFSLTVAMFDFLIEGKSLLIKLFCKI